MQTDFLPTEAVFFLVRAILLLLEIISLVSGMFFRLLETSISTKSFILASSGNGLLFRGFFSEQ